MSVPYRRRELSSLIARDGVTDVLVRVEADDGQVGWGEACSGPDVASVEAAIRSMTPHLVGRDPWSREMIRAELFGHGLWHLRASTGNFAWAGIDMALVDLCARSLGQPLYRLFGGLRRREVSYFYYLSRADADDLAAQCHQGLDAGYDVFYLKVGLDPKDDLSMVATVRDALGSGPKLRIDANGAWSVAQAVRILTKMAEFDIDFVEQPVRDHPIRQLAEVRSRVPMAVAANEGMWSEADAYARITSRQADVYCFSPYWVGSLMNFVRLAHVADLEGLQVCKHTHGELGLAAAACHQLLLTLPNVVEGNQQTAQLMDGDVIAQRLPIADGPVWGVPDGSGLGVDVEPGAVLEAARRYELDGQFLPWSLDRADVQSTQELSLNTQRPRHAP